MNIQQMMQQAKVMQERMQELQDRLGNMEIEGTAGGGMVKVTMTCKGDCRSIFIDPSMMDPSQKEILEDLIKAALNDAKSRADRKLSEETQAMMSDMGLPSNIKLPF